jgi:hypothetical protein
MEKILKACVKCGIRKAGGVGGNKSWCRICTKAYRKEWEAKRRKGIPTKKEPYSDPWYKRNKEKQKEYRKIYKQRSCSFVLEYLQAHPCMDCGEADVVVLEFDHRDPSTKMYNIGTMLDRCFKSEKILEEISKCDVVCANCHKRRTAKQQAWWKYNI